MGLGGDLAVDGAPLLNWRLLDGKPGLRLRHEGRLPFRLAQMGAPAGLGDLGQSSHLLQVLGRLQDSWQ